jgi:hypothetical protein
LTFWFQSIDELHGDELKLALEAALQCSPAEFAEVVDEAEV